MKYETEAERLLDTFRRAGLTVPAPGPQQRKNGSVRGFAEIKVPAEIPDRPRAPLSPLSDPERRQRKIVSGTVVTGEDGALNIQAPGLPEISLTGSDCTYQDGDRVDIAVIRRTGSFQQYVILGRRS